MKNPIYNLLAKQQQPTKFNLICNNKRNHDKINLLILYFRFYYKDFIPKSILFNGKSFQQDNIFWFDHHR